MDGAPYPQGDFVSWQREPARPPLRQGAVRPAREEPPGLHAPAAHRLVRRAARRSAGTSSSAPAAPARSRRSRRRGSPSRRRSADSRRTRTTSPDRRRGTRRPASPPHGRLAAAELEARARLRGRRGRLLLPGRRERRDRHARRSRPAPTPACVTASRRTGRRRSSSRSTEFVDYFASLGRPLGAAFIFPAAQTSCSGTTCTAGLCCQTDCPGRERLHPEHRGQLRRPGARAPARRGRERAPQQGRRRHHRLDLRLRTSARCSTSSPRS